MDPTLQPNQDSPACPPPCTSAQCAGRENGVDYFHRFLESLKLLVSSTCQSPPLEPPPPVRRAIHTCNGEETLPDFPLPPEVQQEKDSTRERLERKAKLSELICWECHPTLDCNGIAQGSYRLVDRYMSPEVSYGSFPPHTLITIGGRSVEIPEPVSEQHQYRLKVDDYHPDFTRCEVAYSLSQPQTHIFFCCYMIHVDKPVTLSWKSYNAIYRMGPDESLMAITNTQKECVISSCGHKVVSPPHLISTLEKGLSAIPVDPSPFFKPPNLFPMIYPTVNSVDIEDDALTAVCRPDTIKQAECGDNNTESREDMLEFEGQFYIPCELTESVVDDLIAKGYVPLCEDGTPVRPIRPLYNGTGTARAAPVPYQPVRDDRFDKPSSLRWGIDLFNDLGTPRDTLVSHCQPNLVRDPGHTSTLDDGVDEADEDTSLACEEWDREAEKNWGSPSTL
eukprot:GHVN01014393.1.p1 GENE.GHVN01014393.1~~GHVN01014393.1.p1  ORF type:complete len:450 (+),score=64.89 GHVN01014393.1:2095-3444(+)